MCGYLSQVRKSQILKHYGKDFWNWFTSWAWNDFAILFWAPTWYLISPYIGAIAFNEVQIVWKENAALLGFLGYQKYDIYLMGLNQQKIKFNQALGIDNVGRATYFVDMPVNQDYSALQQN